MRLIHTSDWHLGHRFHGRPRVEEQGRFLDWLAGLIEREGIDGLLVAGDIFDTSTPGSQTQGLYYRFLHRLARSSCRHIVIIGGNHDSPSLLEAPRELLRQLDIHVVGMVGGNPDKEILLLHDEQGQPELLVCAVPFLRDRDIRLAAPGETLEEKGVRLREGIQEHFRLVCQHAGQMRRDIAPGLPLVVMGHLFVAGGRTLEGDGVRELMIGGLDRVASTVFPDDIDYLALGHLHLGQMVGGNPARRYSGAPLAMSFAEADQTKEILVLECTGRDFTATPVQVPVFQQRAVLRGDLPQLLQGLDQLKAKACPVWVDLHYDGEALVPDLREQVTAAAENSPLVLLRIRNNRSYDYALRQSTETETLDDLQVDEVFERCLAANAIAEDQRPLLRGALTEIIQALASQESEGTA